ncbi:hypothetical protein BV898_07799 [Hypsibius exemplaris]|uniref:Chromo domain-containing protein n=1 Tax=Hypsibius exemplaris TaxID=2072580 RepID=A0A1W0WSP8_HYPEX|nr:hypothetical protein BV898_07799 [Hypsibius exemplaris]
MCCWSSLCDTWEPEDNILDPNLIRAFELNEAIRREKLAKSSGPNGKRKRGRPPKNAPKVSVESDSDSVEEEGDEAEPAAKKESTTSSSSHYQPYQAAASPPGTGCLTEQTFYNGHLESDDDDADSEVTDPDIGRGSRRPSVDIDERKSASTSSVAVELVIKEEERDERDELSSSSSLSLSESDGPSHPVQKEKEPVSEDSLLMGVSDGERTGSEYTQVTSEGYTVTFEEVQNPADFFSDLTEAEIRAQPKPRFGY